jgi:hypothetical protein
MLTGTLGGFEMYSIATRIFVTFVSLSTTTSFPVLASADDFATGNSEAQFCADMMSVVFDPDTGEQIVTRDLCEYDELLRKGYLPEMPVCAFSFGYVRHPETMNTLTYRNTCELNAFLRAGYKVFLRNEGQS